MSEVCKYFAFLLQCLSEGKKTKVVEEGQRHEDEFFMAKWVKLKDGYRVGRARKCIFRRPLL